jgi:hypothetical protein
MDKKERDRKDKQAQRKREAEKGIKRVEVKAHVDDVEEVRDYAETKLKKRGLS